MRIERHQKMAAGFTPSKANAKIEDKGRLPDELAAKISLQLDAGMRIEIPGWGRHSIRPLSISRIIDKYYDTPDRTFQTWSKANGKQLLLRDRHEGTVIGDVNPWNLQTQEEFLKLPVEGETHKWVAKVPLESVTSSRNMRQARENEAPYTDQEREALRAEVIGIIQHTLDIELDPSTVDVREYVGKVRKTYGVFSQSATHASETQVAKIDLDFIMRKYYQSRGISIERYVKYEAEKQGHATTRQFEACAQALRAVLHIPKEEPSSTALRPFSASE